MTWDNDAALNDLLAEGERLDDGYLTVARVLPNRREEQLASVEAGPVAQLGRAVEGATHLLPAGTRVRVRLWRRGGKPVRGLVVRRLGASGRQSIKPIRTAPQAPTPPAPPVAEPLTGAACPSCAELQQALEGQHDRCDEVCDERDAAEALVRRLKSDLADLRGDLDSAVFRAETAERERDNFHRTLSQAEERFIEQDGHVSFLKRENKRLRRLVEQAKVLVAMVNDMEVA